MRMLPYRPHKEREKLEGPQGCLPDWKIMCFYTAIVGDYLWKFFVGWPEIQHGQHPHQQGNYSDLSPIDIVDPLAHIHDLMELQVYLIN